MTPVQSKFIFPSPPLSNICLERSCLEEFKSTAFICVGDTVDVTEENEKLL